MEDNGIDGLVAAPRRPRGVNGGVAGGQGDDGQANRGPRRAAGGGNLVDRIVGLQRRQAGGISRYVPPRREWCLIAGTYWGDAVEPLEPLKIRIRINHRHLQRQPRNAETSSPFPRFRKNYPESEQRQGHLNRATPVYYSTLPQLEDRDAVRGKRWPAINVRGLPRCATTFRHHVRR